MKLIEDKYNFVNEIDIVRNKKILDVCMKIGTILGVTIIESYSTIKNLSEETKNKLKNNKWLIIILIFFVISCIVFYHYTYNYMKDEFTYNNDIIKYINSLDDINMMYLYIPNIKDIKSITLYKVMLDKLNIDHINKYNSIEEYILLLNKNKPKTEVNSEVVPEVVSEVVPEVVQEVVSEVVSEVVPEVVPEVVQEVVPEVVQEVVLEVVQEVNQEVVPEENQEVMPEENLEVVPEENQEVVPEENQEVVPEENQEVVPEAKPEVKQKKEVKNKKDIKQKRQYNKKNNK